MKTIVNLITTIRFVYTLFLPFLESNISNTAFIINIVVLFSTDLIDGFLARKFRVQTLYGSLMDTVADKALSITLLLILIKKINIVSIMLMGEIIIACINTFSLIKGKKTRSRLLGKIKMWFISATITLGYMNYFDIIGYTFVIVGTILTFIMQVITTIDYIIKLRMQKVGAKPIYKAEDKKELKHILFNTEYYLESFKKNS